jgi:hypothetical protein
LTPCRYDISITGSMLHNVMEPPSGMVKTLVKLKASESAISMPHSTRRKVFLFIGFPPQKNYRAGKPTR